VPFCDFSASNHVVIVPLFPLPDLTSSLGYLFYRILLTKTDSRFDERRENPLRFLVFWIFQILWVWVGSLPVTILHGLAQPLPAFGTATDIAGVVVWGLGFIFEVGAFLSGS